MPPQQFNLTKEQSDTLVRLANLFGEEKKDNLFLGKDGVKKLVVGIEKGFDAVKGSYGSAGSNAILEAGLLPGHEMTNDGRKILDSIRLADPVENIGLNILKEVAKKADEISGDGRKTSVILTHAIIKEGLKCKESPMEIKRSLDECLPIILKFIDEQTKQIRTDEVGKIAAVASESEELGRIFGEIYNKIGKDGIVELDTSGLPQTTYDITEGVKLLGCGFHYPYMANEDKGRQAVYENPYVLITKQKIGNIKELDGVLKMLVRQQRNELVVFCDEIDLAVSQALAFIHTKGIEKEGQQILFKTLVIKAPTLWKDWIYEDFAKITGATIIDGVTNSLKNIQLHQLGSCEKVVSTKDTTHVLGIKNIKDHLKVLEEMNTDEGKIRIARLCTKTAILKLGANSESELSYLKGKALDARNASYLALQGGIVEGGGQVYKKLSRSISTMKEGGIKAGPGETILEKALSYPNDLIRENGTTDFKGVFDPATVVKNSIQNALSVASTVLTAKCVITLNK